ncbi:unnamed protein product [Prorocentrum cordatum]|uniref:Signal peptidase complex catalytic subunit SEC11 n=1 Tax=Prorocentrum cordatum TaxID=2364126 RepID=A0ABN9QQX8_9DINO|nr:unnamed protein product [Polarella glacialis]
MIWKGLIVVTGSESPVVVVLSGSMEPGMQRGDILFLTMFDKDRGQSSARYSSPREILSGSFVRSEETAPHMTEVSGLKWPAAEIYSLIETNQMPSLSAAESSGARCSPRLSLRWMRQPLPDPFVPGDVVVFQIEGRDIPIVHRTMNVHEKHDGTVSLLTKGDNNQSGQSWSCRDSGLVEPATVQITTPVHLVLTALPEVDDRGLYTHKQLFIGRKEVMGRAQGFLPYVGMITIWLNDYPGAPRAASAARGASCRALQGPRCLFHPDESRRPCSAPRRLGAAAQWLKYILIGSMGFFVVIGLFLTVDSQTGMSLSLWLHSLTTPCWPSASFWVAHWSLAAETMARWLRMLVACAWYAVLAVTVAALPHISPMETTSHWFWTGEACGGYEVLALLAYGAGSPGCSAHASVLGRYGELGGAAERVREELGGLRAHVGAAYGPAMTARLAKQTKTQDARGEFQVTAGLKGIVPSGSVFQWQAVEAGGDHKRAAAAFFKKWTGVSSIPIQWMEEAAFCDGLDVWVGA